MGYVPFLNSSGAIVAPYTSRGTAQYAAHIPVEPYFETVLLPVVSVDPSALYGDHPEKLATLTYSSGAALTFFCDSEAGGTNTSGAGTFADPWRSMNAASRYLSCHACVLNAAAEYIQLKVKGTIDYHTSSRWDPLGDHRSKFIIRGWDGRCDLAAEPDAPRYTAAYLFGLRVLRGWNVCSNCTVISGGAVLAADCGLAGDSPVDCAYNCSAAGTGSRGDRVNASVCYGGSFGVPLSARYAYAPTVSVGYFIGSSAGLTLHGYGGGPCAAAGATVTVSCHGSSATAIGAGNACLADCCASVIVSQDQSPDNTFGAVARILTGGSAVVGGTWHAAAYAVASGGSIANAEARASRFSSGVAVSGAAVTLIASAAAHITGDSGTEWEGEYIYSGGTTCSKTTTRHIYSGVAWSTYSESGCTP